MGANGEPDAETAPRDRQNPVAGMISGAIILGAVGSSYGLLGTTTGCFYGAIVGYVVDRHLSTSNRPARRDRG